MWIRPCFKQTSNSFFFNYHYFSCLSFCFISMVVKRHSFHLLIFATLYEVAKIFYLSYIFYLLPIFKIKTLLLPKNIIQHLVKHALSLLKTLRSHSSMFSPKQQWQDDTKYSPIVSMQCYRDVKTVKIIKFYTGNWYAFMDIFTSQIV